MRRRDLLAQLAGAALPLALARPAWAQARPTAVRIAAIAVNAPGGVTIKAQPLIARVIDEGWLERELAQRNVKLEWYHVPTGDTGASTNEAFASGRIDFANYGDLPSVILNTESVRTAVIVPTGRGSDMQLLVPTRSTATRLADLRGQRISVHRGRPWELGLRKLIAAEGLQPRDFRIVNLNPPAGAAALASGDVDAHFSIDGYLLEEKGIGRILWNSQGKPLHFKMRAELWGTRAFATQQPELTQLVATAYVRALHWASLPANREAVVQIGTLGGSPVSVVRRSYDDPSLGWSERWDPRVDEVVRSHYRGVADFAFDNKLIRRRVDPAELVDPRFVDAALAQLALASYWKPRVTQVVEAVVR